MSQPEAFKKQAKQLVRWHRDGNHCVGERIRTLPRYRDLTDAQALAMKFPLSEAQEIIAREAGHESWAALKVAAEDALPANEQGHRPNLHAAIPVIFVSNVKSSAEFFRDQLGFSIDFLHGNPPFYGAVSRDEIVVHLRFVHEPVISRELREKEQLLSAFIAVENVKALFLEYKARGVDFVAALRREPWGGPTFTVRDPDGNWLCFSS